LLMKGENSWEKDIGGNYNENYRKKREKCS
jgi:hypothetical protein